MTNEKDYTPVKCGCNGVTVNFGFKWKILSPEDLIILLENKETEEQTELEYNKDYSVEYGAMGGSITTKTAYPDGFSIIVSRKVSQYQGKTFSTTGGFQASEIESAYDRVSTNVQDLDYTLQRAIKVPVGSKVLDLTLPNPVAGRTLKWNDEGTGLINSDVSIDEIDFLVEETRVNKDKAVNAAETAEAQAEIIIEQAEKITETYNAAISDINETTQYSLDRLKGVPYIPCCVNAGRVDENGEADLLEFEYETRTVKAVAPFTYTTVSRKTYNVNSDLSIVIPEELTGTINILVDRDNSGQFYLEAFANTVYIQKAKPQEAMENDIWIDISVAPEKGKMYKSGQWQEYEGIHIGILELEDE